MARARKLGRPKKQDHERTGKRVSAWVRETTYTRVVERAEQDGRTVSEWARRLIETAVGL